MHGMETAYVRATFAEFSWLGTCQMEAGGALAGTRLHGDAMRRERSGSMRRERRSREGNQAVGCGGQEDGDGRHDFPAEIWLFALRPFPNVDRRR